MEKRKRDPQKGTTEKGQKIKQEIWEKDKKRGKGERKSKRVRRSGHLKLR